jgi:rhamnulokinase
MDESGPTSRKAPLLVLHDVSKSFGAVRALAFRRAVRDAQRLSGHEVDVIHVVGGGARNGLLCQLTADACRRPVVAGPVEATALGNVLVQARALGAVSGGLDALRSLARGAERLQRHEPSGDTATWDAAASRVVVLSR